MSALRVEGVTVWREGRCLLDRVSFAVGAGETVGLVGPSGAGKTTLLRVALALERPTEGALYWGDQQPWALRAAALRGARRHVGVVLQQPAASLDPRRTVFESVAEPLDTHAGPLRAAVRRARVLRALDRVGLAASLASRLPRAVSGGEAQRIAIARALIVEPSLVLMDEPTSALDPSAAASLLNLIADLCGQQTVAFLIVSHDLAAVGALARRLLVLDAGRLVADGPTDSLYAAPPCAALAAALAARV